MEFRISEVPRLSFKGDENLLLNHLKQAVI